jgi:hypothetical protein
LQVTSKTKRRNPLQITKSYASLSIQRSPACNVH